MNRIFTKNTFRNLLLIFSAAFLILGLSISDDYGVGPDEFNDMRFGKCTYRLYFPNEFTPNDGWCLDDPHYLLHTPFWQMTLQIITKFIPAQDIKDEIQIRFMANFVLFFIAVICFYFLLNDLFREKKWSIIGVLFLILCPRIFAYSFFDGSDSAALSFWIIGTFSMFRLFNSPGSLKNCITHAVVSAAALSSRLPLVSIPLITITGLLFLGNHQKLKSIFVYLVSLIVAVLCFWPQLWSSPLSLFIKSLVSTATYKHLVPSYFFGHLKSDQTPWYYNFFWMSVTIPLFCLIPGIFGTVISTRSVLSFKKLTQLHTFKIASLYASFTVPLVLTIITKVSLYGAWRHHHFIFPAFVILSVLGVQKIYSFLFDKTKWATFVFNAFLALGFMTTVYKMIKFHPYQGTYFNELSCFFSVEKNLLVDVWGNSYREGLRKILAIDGDEVIPVEIDTYNGSTHFFSLSPTERARLTFTKPKEAKYLLTTNIWNHQYFEKKYGPVIYTLTSDSKDILKIYKNRNYKGTKEAEPDFI